MGTVLTAEKVEKADKLLRLTVDIGIEVRQIVAGIAKAYDPAARWAARWSSSPTSLRANSAESRARA